MTGPDAWIRSSTALAPHVEDRGLGQGRGGGRGNRSRSQESERHDLPAVMQCLSLSAPRWTGRQLPLSTASMSTQSGPGTLRTRNVTVRVAEVGYHFDQTTRR